MSELKRQSRDRVELKKAIENWHTHIRGNEIAEGKRVMSEYVRVYAPTPYVLAAIAYNAGVIAGKRSERQRKKPHKEEVNRWPFIETAYGRNLWESCKESGDFKPYQKAQARYELECDMILGVTPAKSQPRIVGSTPSSSYKDLLDKDLPRVSEKLGSITQTLAMLQSTMEAMTARADAVREWIDEGNNAE